jgi:hypothetical protein
LPVHPNPKRDNMRLLRIVRKVDRCFAHGIEIVVRVGADSGWPPEAGPPDTKAQGPMALSV